LRSVSSPPEVGVSTTIVRTAAIPGRSDHQIPEPPATAAARMMATTAAFGPFRGRGPALDAQAVEDLPV